MIECRHVLNHVEDPTAVLSKMADVLNKNGGISISLNAGFVITNNTQKFKFRFCLAFINFFDYRVGRGGLIHAQELAKLVIKNAKTR